MISKLQSQLLACLCLVATVTAAAQPQGAVLLGGESRNATLVEVVTDGKLTNLVAWGAPVEPRQAPLVLLADGGLLVADVSGADEERLTVDCYSLRKLALPLEQIAGIVFHPPLEMHRRDKLLQKVRSATAKSDRLILDNADEISGTVLTLDAKEVEVETAVGKVKIETDRVLALAFDPSLAQPARHEGARVLVGLDDGSRVLTKSLALADGKAQLTLVDDQQLKVPSESVVFLQPLGGRIKYLSDLKPASYKHIPFLELAWEHQFDRNVLQAPLRSGGQLYLKGVGMHSASRLTFPLDGHHKRFASEAALDDLAAGRGSVVFRVFVDNEQKYASPILRGGDSPIPISVDLPPTAKSISLIVDFADRGDELDYANWLHARLEE